MNEEKRYLTASFSYTDTNGNQVIGAYGNDDLADLLEYLGDNLTRRELFWDKVKPDSTDGIVDLNKPITITISR